MEGSGDVVVEELSPSLVDFLETEGDNFMRSHSLDLLDVLGIFDLEPSVSGEETFGESILNSFF